jgi:hypothetical protein
MNKFERILIYFNFISFIGFFCYLGYETTYSKSQMPVEELLSRQEMLDNEFKKIFEKDPDYKTALQQEPKVGSPEKKQQQLKGSKTKSSRSEAKKDRIERERVYYYMHKPGMDNNKGISKYDPTIIPPEIKSKRKPLKYYADGPLKTKNPNKEIYRLKMRVINQAAYFELKQKQINDKLK